MAKLALVIIVIVFLAGVTFYLVYNKTKPAALTQALQEVPKDLPFSAYSGDATPSAAPKSLDSPVTNPGDDKIKIALLENKVKILESSIANLSSRITSLESAPKTTQTSSSSQKTPVYIPINSGGSIDSTTYSNLTSGTITLNSTDYPGYTNMYLIVNLAVSVGQGKAYARLVNTSNSLAILVSEVSTSSYSTVSLTSPAFQLPSGSNTYTVQLKTLVQGYPAQAGYSFIKVVF